MKKIITILSFCISLTTLAQIPNNSFENWTFNGQYSDPNGWTSYNAYTYQAGVTTCVQGSPGFSGSYYMSLITKTMTPSGSMFGFVISGTPIPGNNTTFKGYPFTSRPASLDGHWQYNCPTTASNCSITVYMSKWNTSLLKRDTICFQSVVLSGTVSAWTAFSISLLNGYKSLANPDSCVISMRSSLTAAVPVGSFLHVDALSFNGTATGINEMTLNDKLRIYPNPFSRYVRIETSENENAEISIIDQMGREVISSAEHTLDLEMLKPGVYTVRCNIDNKFYYKKIIKT
ncbi:MAG: T9SS type A sorting domain-containing protein [Bacteroidia bacterium]